MCTIFSSVVADIAHDLVKQFPKDFDFRAMLAKVGEDAGVCIKFEKSVTRGSGKSTCYKLQGLWTAVEHAYRQLVAAVALHGVAQANKENPAQTTPVKSKGQQLQQKLKEQKSLRESHRKGLNSSTTSCCENAESKTEENDNDEDASIEVRSTQEHNQADVDESAASTKQEDTEQVCCEVAPEAEPKEDALQHSPETATAQRKERSRKSAVPKQLPQAGHKYSFLSKYRDQNYPSLSKNVRKRRKVIPESSESCHSAVKTKSERGQKHDKQLNGSELSCRECQFVTTKKSKLREHIQKQHKGSPESCDVCGKIFQSQTYMLRHRSSHTGPQHCCDVCGKMFKVKKAMVKHRKTHEEGYTRPVFPCKLCTKTFCSQYLADYHVRSFHLGQRKNYLCSFCGKKFTTKNSLQEHVNAHIGLKPHTCEICGKGFCYDSALREHRFTHGDEKQFKCDLCDKSFCQRSGLKMHMRIHKDTKQFQCQECGREFTQKQALQRHERVHKGVKPYMCKLCSRSFSDASIIRRHLTLVHKIHKDAKAWREDIVCTVQPDEEYHVGYIGKTETHHQSDKVQKDSAVVKVKTVVHNKVRTERNSKKSKTALKENRTEVNIPLPVHLHSISAVHESVHTFSDRQELSSVAASHSNSLQPVTTSTDPQAMSPSQQNLFLTSEYLPQTHDPSCIETPPQDQMYSVSSVSDMQSQQPGASAAGRQGYVNAGAITGSMDELHHNASLCVTSAAEPVSHSAFPHGPVVQSSTSGEHEHKPPFSPLQHLRSVEKDTTTVPMCATTTTTTSASTTIAAPQPLPSLYYYSQLASQFGMSLSEYPYIANTVFNGLGLSPSSPGLEHPSPTFPRPQSLGHLSAGVDPSSSILLRLQGQGLSNSDLPHGRGGTGRDSQDVYGGGHSLMLSSPLVESSRSSLLLDSSGDGLNMSDALPITSASQKCGDDMSRSSLS